MSSVGGEYFSDNSHNFASTELQAGFREGVVAFVGVLPMVGCSVLIAGQAERETAKLGWRYADNEDAYEAGAFTELRPCEIEDEAVPIFLDQLQTISDILGGVFQDAAVQISPAQVHVLAAKYTVVSELACNIPLALARYSHPLSNQFDATIPFYGFLALHERGVKTSDISTFMESMDAEEWDELLIACMDRFGSSVALISLMSELKPMVGEQTAVKIGADFVLGANLSGDKVTSQRLGESIAPSVIWSVIDAFSRKTHDENAVRFGAN